MKKKPLAGALVVAESEEETAFLLKELKKWLPSKVNFMTIDFSPRLEAGVNEVFPDVQLQKCVFHAVQLLIRGLRKELTKIKKKHLLDHIKEWKILRRMTLKLEKQKQKINPLSFRFHDVKIAKEIFMQLRKCLSHDSPKEIKQALHSFFSRPPFLNWKGKQVFLSKYEDIFTKAQLRYSNKGFNYIIPKIYIGFRAAIRELRQELEERKSHFNKIKHLVLMNPVNMKPYHRTALRKYLKIFPWLRTYRKLVVKFYYQFRVTPEKRVSLSFLSRLIHEDSHRWLKSAVQTLIENEENVFRFQHFPEKFPKVKFSKSIKVVNESVNKLVNRLYRTQCGMRTLENIRMRVSHRLNCPILLSPALLEKLK